MTRELARRVRERAREQCEYCQLPQSAFPFSFQLDHILAEKHGGETVESNLALACPHCNRHKGPNIAGVDPNSGQLVRLFHPRQDRWSEHFQWEGTYLVGKTAVGSVTIQVLAMNAHDQQIVREELLQEGGSSADDQ